MKQTNVRQFFAQFLSDEACLEHLFNVRFGQGHSCPKCEWDAKWYRLKSEQAFSCQWCGHHIHPMVGSIFEKSRTPLQLWFYAIFLFTTSKHGFSGKELRCQLGVTYKTAWRMAALIREHMAAITLTTTGCSAMVFYIHLARSKIQSGPTTLMRWRASFSDANAAF